MQETQDNAPTAISRAGSSANGRAVIAVIALLLLAFALRLLLLEAQSIWWDEGISLHLATSSWSEILRDRLGNIHPPLYFMLLKGWLTAAGVGAFSGRYFSVLASWLQVAALCGIAWRWFGQRTGLAALVLGAFSAVSVIYGQEIRAYALLALVYILLLGLTRELTRFRDVEDGQPTSLWLAWAFLVWFGIHLHYIAVFAAAYAALWAMVAFVHRRRWRALQRLLLALYLVFLASLPWFLAVWRNWSTVTREAFAGTFGSLPAPPSFLASQFWVFQLTGLAGALAKPGVPQLAAATAALLLILVLIRLAQRGTRHDTAALLAHWLIPLSSAVVVWTVRSFSHPRYISMFAPGLVMLAAYVTVPPKGGAGRRLLRLPELLATLSFLSILLSSAAGLWLYFVDPSVAKDDIRGAARYLETEAAGNDLILIPDTDWSFPFEYQGDTAIGMPGLDNPGDPWTRLMILTAGYDRVYLLDYDHGTRDWQGLLPFALGSAGTLEAEKEFDGVRVQTYALRDRVRPPELQPLQIRFGPLLLLGTWIEQDGISGEELTVALRWELEETMDDDARISLRLLDAKGFVVAEENDLLVDENGRPSQLWITGQPVTTYHRISIPTAVPPFAYDVELRAYTGSGQAIAPLDILDDEGAPAGQAALLGKSHVTFVQPTSGRNQDALPITPEGEPLPVAPGLLLLASEIEGDAAEAGQPLSVLLLWQSTADHSADIPLEIALEQEGAVIANNNEAPVYGRYPVSVWSSGEQVFERRILEVPGDAAGRVDVVLKAGDKDFQLGAIEVTAVEHNFAEPEVSYELETTYGDVARLVGFDLPETAFSVEDTIPITLVWQSLRGESDRDLVVFAHLLDDHGRLIAQHDGPPANGARLTGSWVENEYIVDEHELSFQDTDYRGSAQIEIGLYDPVSGARLLREDGSDFLLLPVQVTVR